MVVKWSATLLVVVMVVVSLITRIDCLLDHPLQSLDADIDGNSLDKTEQPPLREFYDHAEYKASVSTEEQTTDLSSTTESSQPLPTPIPVKQKKSDFEDLKTKKKLSVPKKGVPSLKSSVVPKKEVHFAPSVVAKKGADPESSTPSVSPRKGVELSQGSLVHNLLLVSSENMNNTNVSPLLGDGKDSKATVGISEVQDQANSEGEGYGDRTPIPQLVQKGTSNDLSPSVKATSSQLTDSPSTASPSSVKSDSTSKITHFKPTTADDVGVANSQMSYAPILIIVALILLVVVVVAVGYHRLKDIWLRRHYNYVDFLIDGMYE